MKFFTGWNKAIFKINIFIIYGIYFCDIFVTSSAFFSVLQVLVNGRQIDVVDWSTTGHVTELDLRPQGHGSVLLQIVVENCGRVNYADFNSSVLNNQRKGTD